MEAFAVRLFTLLTIGLPTRWCLCILLGIRLEEVAYKKQLASLLASGKAGIGTGGGGGYVV